MPLFAEHVPEHDRTSFVAQLDAECLRTLSDLRIVAASRRDPRKVPLNVGHEHGNTDARKLLRHRLQRHGLARTSRARDESVAVAERGQQSEIGVARFRDQQWVGHMVTLLRESLAPKRALLPWLLG